MDGYFKPLRRKIGVFTLLFACLFAAAWVRGLNGGDVIPLDFGERRWNVISGCGSFQLVEGTFVQSTLEVEANEDAPVSYFLLEFSRTVVSGDTTWSKLTAPKIAIKTTSDAGGSTMVRMVPYWFIVIPLTLLSAWLLLSKPRSAKSVPTSEPRGARG